MRKKMSWTTPFLCKLILSLERDSLRLLMRSRGSICAQKIPETATTTTYFVRDWAKSSPRATRWLSSSGLSIGYSGKKSLALLYADAFGRPLLRILFLACLAILECMHDLSDGSLNCDWSPEGTSQDWAKLPDSCRRRRHQCNPRGYWL
jgi:hypothetical protein